MTTPNPNSQTEAISKWQQFKSQKGFVLFEYPFRRAATAAIESVKLPDNKELREKALVAIAQFETTEELLKQVAPFMGGMYGN